MIRLFHVHVPGRTVALALTEAFVLVFALVLASYTQFGADASVVLTYQNTLLKVVLASAACMMFMHYHDLYHSVVLHSLGAVLTRLLQVVGAICVVLGLLYYALPLSTFGYELVVTWIVLAGVCLAIWRTLFFFFNRSNRLRYRAVLVGDSPLYATLVQEIAMRPELGLQLVGYIALDKNNRPPDHLRSLGTSQELPAIVKREKISRVIVGRRGTDELSALEQWKGLAVERAEELYEAIFDKLPVTHGSISEYNIPPSVIVFKHVSSVVLAGAGLILTAPIMAVAAIAIRLDSRGPVIFKQKRVGKNGVEFTLYKFRSMRHGADREGTSAPAARNDSRFTRVGRFLRKTRMDELPQLWNVLLGDMYLVGPRPFTVDMETELSRKIPHYSDRWLIKPGITGWAQIRRPYCSSIEDNVDKLAHDLFYIRNMSIGLDFLICVETVKILLLGRGAQ